MEKKAEEHGKGDNEKSKDEKEHADKNLAPTLPPKTPVGGAYGQFRKVNREKFKKAARVSGPVKSPRWRS
jgi:hypothetical protein